MHLAGASSVATRAQSFNRNFQGLRHVHFATLSLRWGLSVALSRHGTINMVSACCLVSFESLSRLSRTFESALTKAACSRTRNHKETSHGCIKPQLGSCTSSRSARLTAGRMSGPLDPVLGKHLKQLPPWSSTSLGQPAGDGAAGLRVGYPRVGRELKRAAEPALWPALAQARAAHSNLRLTQAAPSAAHCVAIVSHKLTHSCCLLASGTGKASNSGYCKTSTRHQSSQG